VCCVGWWHGGRLGLGCIVQRVRGLYVLVAFYTFFLSVLVGCFCLPDPPLWRHFFRSILEWLLTRCCVLVASPLLCALRCWARRGAAGAVCGGGRRHGGRLGCFVQLVRSLYVLVACLYLCAYRLLFFCVCPSRHDGALPSVPSLSGFSRGDLFWFLPCCFVRCGVGRGVAWRAWCVAAGGGTAGVLVLVASCSACVAYKCWLRFCLSFYACGVLGYCSALSGLSRGDLFWLFPRCYCGVGRGGPGVWRRAAARRASWSWLPLAASAWLIRVCCVFVFLCLWVLYFFLCPSRHDAASCSLCVAYKCWLRFCLSVFVAS